MTGNVIYFCFRFVANNFLCCIISGKSCGEPPIPENGAIFSGSFLTGDQVTYICDEGYVFADIRHNSRICRADMTWSGVTPTCISKCIMHFIPLNSCLSVSY